MGFVNDETLVCGQVGKGLGLPAGPMNRCARDFRGIAQSKVDGGGVGGCIGTASDAMFYPFLPSRPLGFELHLDPCAYRIPIASGSDKIQF